MYKITGQVAYVNRIWDEVKALMAFPDWHPEHYLDTAEILYPMAIAFAMDGVKKRLYAEIVSSDTSLKFTSGPAISYDPDYSTTHSDVDKEYDRSDYSKLMIITSGKVSTFNNAVAFKFIDNDESRPDAGTLYQWSSLETWK